MITMNNEILHWISRQWGTIGGKAGKISPHLVVELIVWYWGLFLNFDSFSMLMEYTCMKEGKLVKGFAKTRLKLSQNKTFKKWV